MRISTLKKDNRFDTRSDPKLKVQTYGEHNDYPQQVLEVVQASNTGRTCVGVYSKFMFGQGFLDDRLYGVAVNGGGQTADDLLDQVVSDLAHFGGFAIHINWSVSHKILSLQHVPLETIRFSPLTESGSFTHYVVHPDWGKRAQNRRHLRPADADFIDRFNPDPAVIDLQVEAAGGWSTYNGQIYYYSNMGPGSYPLPVFDAALTDMNTEEGTSNVSNRTVRHNFLPAGMLVDYSNVDETEEQESATEADLLDYQGDENASKLMYVQCRNKEEKPEFIPFTSANFASQFNTIEKSVQTNIGKSFNQPPILRAETVSANFGADIMRQAYNYYNSVTGRERILLERTFSKLFDYLAPGSGLDFRVNPLSYETEMTFAERIGDAGVSQILEIVTSDQLDNNQKRQLVRTLFSPTSEELDGIMPATI